MGTGGVGGGRVGLESVCESFKCIATDAHKESHKAGHFTFLAHYVQGFNQKPACFYLQILQTGFKFCFPYRVAVHRLQPGNKNVTHVRVRRPPFQ